MVISTPSAQPVPGLQPKGPVQPGCAPFFHRAGHAQAVLFIHGLTGTPQDFRAYARAYEPHFDVAAPLLPGHGRHISQLEGLTYRELTIPLPPLAAYLNANYRRVHLVGMSYGAAPAGDLALAGEGHSLSLFAPAFYLTESSERSMRWAGRLGLHRLLSRVPKQRLNPNRAANGPPATFTYDAIPLGPALSLHRHMAQLRERMGKLRLPVYHAHGDRDPTMPLRENCDFLARVLPGRTFYHFSGGEHVLTTCPGQEDMAAHHIQWLKGLS